MAVNIFLSNHIWTVPRNATFMRYHVAELYEEVFRGFEVHMYPKGSTGDLLGDGLRHLPALLKGKINVITPGYPIVTGALASWFKRNPGLIVHTWKVPGISDSHLSARLYDSLLRRVFDHARAVVVASHVQRRQVEALRVTCPVLFAPVTVDSGFWQPEPDKMDAHLAKFGLKRDAYVLTVGSSDRDERYGALLAHALELPYVRSTNDPVWVPRIQEILVRNGLDNSTKLLALPSDTELRALYAGARIVCLPTITRTNPAGLSALVEALACGALVGVPESIAEGYVFDGANGMLLRDRPEEFAEQVTLNSARVPSIRLAARKFAEEQLNVLHVGTCLRSTLLG